MVSSSQTRIDAFLIYCIIGSDLRTVTSITRSISDQINTLPIHWTVATNFSETATHTIDFGPGGLSGIGNLTARNLQGRGVKVVIVGDEGKSGAEIYDSKEVRYEQWWAKRWGPSLLKTRYALYILKLLLLFTNYVTS